MSMEIEIERKWLVTSDQMERFLSKRNKKLIRIEQRYFTALEMEVEDYNLFLSISKLEHRADIKVPLPYALKDLTPKKFQKYGARLRKSIQGKDISYEFTVKLPNNEGGKKEYNIDLTSDDAAYFSIVAAQHDTFSHNPSGLISKNRFVTTVNGFHHDCDKFTNRDLNIIEVEFDSIEAAESFVPEFDYIREASNDKAMSNKYMAFHYAAPDRVKANLEIFIAQLKEEADAVLDGDRDLDFNHELSRRYNNIARKLSEIIEV